MALSEKSFRKTLNAWKNTAGERVSDFILRTYIKRQSAQVRLNEPKVISLKQVCSIGEKNYLTTVRYW